MSEPDKPTTPADLGARIQRLRGESGLDAGKGDDADIPPPSGLGLAWRISIELVVALVVGTGLGWVFDQWFGTTPWLMVVFLFLGAAAGINNVVRTMTRMDAQAEAARQRQQADRQPPRGNGSKRGG